MDNSTLGLTKVTGVETPAVIVLGERWRCLMEKMLKTADFSGDSKCIAISIVCLFLNFVRTITWDRWMDGWMSLSRVKPGDTAI